MSKTSGQLERERRLKNSEIIINDYSVCHYCKSTGLDENVQFCPNCRFPQRGTQLDMKRFMVGVQKKKKLLEEQKKAIAKARNILFILAGINLVFGLILGVALAFDWLILISSILGAGIYLGLGIWSLKKPFAAILSGFFVYIVILVLTALADPGSLVHGFIWKILIISGFYYGYKGVKDSEKLEKELRALNESKDLSESNEL
jgi:hypothetical protein